jgi:hypothetical protein
MTTDTELRDLLTAEAAVTTGGPRSWDDVTRRGRHRRRVLRARSAALAAVVAGAIVTTVALSGDDPTVETVPPASGPGRTTVADGSATTEPLRFGVQYPNVEAARAQGVFLTLQVSWITPPRGFDPCADLHPRVVESPEQVSIELVGDAAEGALPWAECHLSSEPGPESYNAGPTTYVYGGGQATIELQDPLSARTVFDLGTSEEVPVAQEVLFPSDVPEPFDLERWDQTAGNFHATNEEGFLTNQASWTFTWSAADHDLSVTTGTRALGECEGEAGDIAVRGTTGRLCASEQTGGGVDYDLRWEEDGRMIAIAIGSSGPDPLTVDDVLAVAEGLVPLR